MRARRQPKPVISGIALAAFIAASLSPSAQGADNLNFTARIEDDALAEESILLLHCLSDRSGRSWELSTQPTGSFWLSLRQEGKVAKGNYHKPEREQQFVLEQGSAQAACDRLEPLSAFDAVKPAAPLPRDQALVEQSATANEATFTPVRNKWLWAAGTAGLLLGGFFLWKSRQADYHRIQMN
jgi:hypothetical protein